jgi:hypothetical protein
MRPVHGSSNLGFSTVACRPEHNKNDFGLGRGRPVPLGCKNPLRLETKFLSNLKLIWAVQMAKQKYSAFQNTQSGPYSVSARATMRDVRAIVTERGAGCDGRCGVSAVQTVRTKTLTAYGEVVWSWRRDPGVKLARSIALTTVARKAAHRGEHEGNRKPIARGKPGCLGCTCHTRVHSLTTIAHGAAGAVGARLSLRPLR